MSTETSVTQLAREVVSFRATEDEIIAINKALPEGCTRAQFVHDTVMAHVATINAQSGEKGGSRGRKKGR